MSKPSVAHTLITRVTEHGAEETSDLLAAEEPLEIRIGYGHANSRAQKSISVTMRTPGNDFELALGFLYTEGIISGLAQVHSIRYCTELNTLENHENIVRVELHENVEIDFTRLQRNFYTTSSCGVCGKESIAAVRVSCPDHVRSTEIVVSKHLLLELPARLRTNQNVFEYTGGLHASALFDTTGSIQLLREDVGRHNALDKLIGKALQSAWDLSGNILLLSGRASFELLQKAAMAGIPVVCAVGAPSSLAVQLAKDFNITLVGFLRDNRFNIYSSPERIVF